MLLVTTALEDTWGTDEEILFLGEWCKLYDRKDIWGNRNSITLKDPFSDRERRFAAYKYTDEVFNRAMESLKESLNEFHKTDHPLRFWKTICEPWLRIFITSTYHNWECVSDTVGKFQNLEIIEIKTNSRDHIPIDMQSFESKLVSDSWNNYIFSLIIKARANELDLKTIETKENISNTLNSLNLSVNKSMKRRVLSKIYMLLLKGFDYAARIFNSSTAVLIVNPYLSKLNNLKLRIRLRVFARSVPRQEFNQPYEHNKDFRRPLSSSDENYLEYEAFLNKILLEQMPFIYAEGFSDLKKEAEKNRWPKTPSSIVTAVDYLSNDVFKYYCATKILSGTKIKTICHGGAGKYKYSDWQAMDFNVCDDHFTWGWSEYSSKCVKGFFVKDTGYRRKGNKDEKSLLHIPLSQFRYQKGLDAAPSYEQYINGYINDQICFLQELRSDVKSSTIVKLSHDFQNSLKRRINDKCPKTLYATLSDDFYKMSSSAKIVVATYSSTTVHETLAMNIPTIMFWRREHWELAPTAIPYFDKLVSCGVFHSSPESAATMVNKIWDNVDGWWQSKEVLSACDDFRAWFCREAEDPIGELADFCKM